MQEASARITEIPKALGRVLCVFAHPDDEAYLAGALMATAVEAGQQVTCVTATKGEAGFPEDDERSAEERAAVREAELAECMRTLGVRDHRWMPYLDGRCESVPLDEPVATLEELIAGERPDTVLTFGPDGMTGHSDHIAVSRWTTTAFRAVGINGSRLLYATKTHDWNKRMGAVMDMDTIMMVEDMDPPAVDHDELALYLDVGGDLLQRKIRALAAQASQTAGFIQMVGDEVYADLVREELFRSATPADWAD